MEVISDPKCLSVDVVTNGTIDGVGAVDVSQHSGSSLPRAVLHNFSLCFSNFLQYKIVWMLP